MKRVLFTAVLLAALFVVVACGRSRDEPEPAPTAIPVAEEAVIEEEEVAEKPAAEEAAPEDTVAEEESSESESEEADSDGEAAAEDSTEDPVVDAEAVEESAESDDRSEGAESEEANESEIAQGLGSKITVLLNDLFFGETNDNLTNPPVWTVGSGEAVTLTMQNLSVAVKHNWAVIKQGAEISVPYNAETDAESLFYESGLVEAESETELTFTAPDVGEYLVICTEPGHSVLMQGKLVVE